MRGGISASGRRVAWVVGQVVGRLWCGRPGRGVLTLGCRVFFGTGFVRGRPGRQGAVPSDSGYSSPYSPSVENSIARSNASAALAVICLICTNICL